VTPTRINGKHFTPYKDKVLVSELDHGVKQTAGGIILIDDNMTERGVRERWAKIFAIGSEVVDFEVGQWVLIKHGRWTNGMDFEFDDETTRVWMIDPEAVLLISDEDPRTTTDKTL
jgi:co-chaperonin GroES (HSP10)